MPPPPPPLANGYRWLAHTVLAAEQVERLRGRLQGIRYVLHEQDHAIFGDPRHDTGIELWVHPEDARHAGAALRSLYAEG